MSGHPGDLEFERGTAPPRALLLAFPPPGDCPPQLRPIPRGGLLLGRRRGPAAGQPLLVPGVSIAQLEAGIGSAAGALAAQRPQLADPNQQVRDRARALVQSDPGKAAQILKAWMSEDQPHA